MSTTSSSTPASSTSPSSQTLSNRSTDKHPRRPGYSKPHSQPFADSAQKRSSVTSLGRIDHLQHRFARGPRLTGRYKEANRKGQGCQESGSSGLFARSSVSNEALSEDSDEFSEDEYDPQSVPLPPSPVQRKFHRSVSDDVDHSRMRTNLSEQLCHARNLLVTHEEETGLTDASKETILSIVSTVAKCIRLARRYSTTIPSYRSIATTYSVFREDAIEVRSQLESVIEREGAGGLTQHEHSTIVTWFAHMQTYLTEERNKFDCQTVDWLHDSLWKDREEVRHKDFLQFYSRSSDTTALVMNYPDNLQELSTGTTLCSVFNAVVLRSKKPFGLILRYHDDVSIRYRVLENLRFWKAALSYRFDVELEQFDVHEIFAMTAVGLKQLQDAIRSFCRIAIAEMLQTVQAKAEHNQEEEVLKEVKRLSIGVS